MRLIWGQLGGLCSSMPCHTGAQWDPDTGAADGFWPPAWRGLLTQLATDQAGAATAGGL